MKSSSIEEKFAKNKIYLMNKRVIKFYKNNFNYKNLYDFLKRNSVLNESEEFRLTEFLSLVDGLHEMKDSRKQLKSSGDGSLLRETNGQKIWRCICNGGE